MSEFCNSAPCRKSSAMLVDTATTDDELEESVGDIGEPGDEAKCGADEALTSFAIWTDVFNSQNRVIDIPSGTTCVVEFGMITTVAAPASVPSGSGTSLSRAKLFMILNPVLSLIVIGGMGSTRPSSIK